MPPPRTIEESAALVCEGAVTPSALVADALAWVRAMDGELHSIGTLTEARAIRHAEGLDRLLEAGVHLGPLHGIPIVVKDNIDTAGVHTTSGSPLHKDRVPDRDATAVHRLQAAGAVLIGKANLYEWAYGGPSGLWGEARNPWNLACTAGASSNGSAVAVAAGLVPGAVGTDLGGSIRIPAAMCGTFGLKPTSGRVSRAGVVPDSSTLDTVGPMTRTATDAALLLAAMAGPDHRDPSSLGAAAVDDYANAAAQQVAGLRVGVPRLPDDEYLHPDVAAAYADAAATFTSLGCHVVDIDLPDLADARTLMWIISAVEGAEFHRDLLREHGDSYQPNVRRLLLTGAFVSGEDYVHCLRVRRVLMDQMTAVFRRVDLVLMPVLPRAPWEADLTEVPLGDVVEDKMSAMTRFSPLFNLTGHPAASLLAGFDPTGLPLSVQLAAPLFQESTILRAAAAFEKATGFWRRRPPDPTGLETATDMSKGPRQ